MKKRVLSIALSVIMVFSLMPLSVFAQEVPDDLSPDLIALLEDAGLTKQDYLWAQGVVEDETATAELALSQQETLADVMTAVSDDAGVYSLGTEESPFIIANASQLNELSSYVSSDNEKVRTRFASAHYIMQNDIDLSAYKNWKPIGTAEKPFAGVFDGEHHKITGITINTPDKSNVGLFGYVEGTKTAEAQIKNVVVVNSDITAAGFAGAVVGFYSDYCNSLKGCGMLGGSVEAVASDESNGGHVGGVVGNAVSRVLLCYATGDVKGTDFYTGGVAGSAELIDYCVALNYSVSSDTAMYGRVCGTSTEYDENELECFAWSGMHINEAVEGTGLNGFDLIYADESFELVIEEVELADEDVPEWVKNDTAPSATVYIKTPAQLAQLAAEVNAGDSKEGRTYILKSNIDLSRYAPGTSLGGATGWTPIGTNESPFKGVFDGNDYNITGLKINNTAADYQGLFGKIEGAEIKNLAVIKADIKGNDCVGAVFGASGYSDNSESVITRCCASGVVAGNSKTGGIAGITSSARINNVYSLCNVNSNKTAGGFVGQTDRATNITNCYATGNLTCTADNPQNSQMGGFAGFINYSSYVECCYAAGSISNADCACGIAGEFYRRGSMLKNCIAFNQSVSGTGENARIASNVTDKTSVTGCYAFDKMTGSFSASGENGKDIMYKSGAFSVPFEDIFGADNSEWHYPERSLPVLADNVGTQSQSVPKYIRESHNTVKEIETAAQLAQLAAEVNAGDNKDTITYLLKNDIDLSDYAPGTALGGKTGWTPIGTAANKFSGILDGGGHTIRGLKINNETAENQALIGYAEYVIIRNLCVSGAEIKGGKNTAAIVSMVDGNTQDSEIINCSSSGTVTGTENVGGIVGYSSYVNIKSCFSSCTVSGDKNTGGFVGSANIYTTIRNCYSTGDVVSTDTVSEKTKTGGFVGSSNTFADIKYCYSTGTISNAGYGGGISGCYLFAAWLENCVALNNSVSGRGENARIVANIATKYTNYYKSCYAWNGMTVEPGTTGEQGKDLAYDNNRFSIQFSEIFGKDNAAWNYTENALPTLKDAVGPQSSAVPQYIVDAQKNEPVYIETAAQLARLAAEVNAGDSKEGIKYILKNDIDLSDYAPGTALGGETGWTPIGTYISHSDRRPFNGIFDGNGHTVTGLKIDNQTQDYQGLFGFSEKGSVKNLCVSDASVIGKEYVGAVVGYLKLVYDENNDEDDIPQMENCSSSGEVRGESAVGGLVGGLGSADVVSCFSSCDVSGGYELGGFAGGAYIDAYIANCYATGSVTCTDVRAQSIDNDFYSMTGGFVGYIGMNAYEINSCYATGTVSGVKYGGGFAGSIYPDSKVINCVALNESVSGIGGNARIASDVYPSAVTDNCYAWDGIKVLPERTNEFGTDISYKNNEFSTQFSKIFGEDNTAWIYTNNNMPTLANAVGPQSSTVPQYIMDADKTVVKITTAAQLAQLSAEVNAGDSKEGVIYYLINNIDLSDYAPGTELGGEEGWTPIGIYKGDEGKTPFSGIFDGLGHTITGLAINTEKNNQGLFRYISKAEIRNLKLSNIDISAASDVGGVVGFAEDSVITDCTVSGTVTGSAQCIGGVVGLMNGGRIDKCGSECKIFGQSGIGGVAGAIQDNSYISVCYATGDVTATECNQDSINWQIGGLVGYVYDDSQVTDSYATGNVFGRGKCVGGLAGLSYGVIGNCYASGKISGKARKVGGIAGTAEKLYCCVALNPSISGSLEVGMVAGSIYSDDEVSSEVFYCYALNSMSVTMADFSSSYKDSHEDGTALYIRDGLLYTTNYAASTANVWWGFFTDTWELRYNEPGKLPKLIGTDDDPSFSLELQAKQETPVNINKGSLVLTENDGKLYYTQGDSEAVEYNGTLVIRGSEFTPTENTVTIESGSHDVVLRKVNIDSTETPVVIKWGCKSKLTLDRVTLIGESGYGMFSDYDTSVTLLNKNTIAAYGADADNDMVNGEVCSALWCNENLSVSGTGSLDLNAGSATLSLGLRARVLTVEESASLRATGGNAELISVGIMAAGNGNGKTAFSVSNDATVWARSGNITETVSFGGSYGIYASGTTVLKSGEIACFGGTGNCNADLEEEINVSSGSGFFTIGLEVSGGLLHAVGGKWTGNNFESCGVEATSITLSDGIIDSYSGEGISDIANRVLYSGVMVNGAGSTVTGGRFYCFGDIGYSGKLPTMLGGMFEVVGQNGLMLENSSSDFVDSFDFPSNMVAKTSTVYYGENPVEYVSGTKFPDGTEFLYVGEAYNVTLDRCGGTSGAESFKAGFATGTLFGYSSPSREGYVFDGYYTQKDGLGLKIIDADGVYVSGVRYYINNAGYWMRTEAQTTLYAKWTKIVGVSGIALDNTQLTLIKGEKDTAVLTAQVTPDTAADKSVTWESSNPSVATVDSSGKVTAVNYGTADITATTVDGEYTAVCAVTVKPAMNQKYIGEPKDGKYSVTTSAGLTVTVTPSAPLKDGLRLVVGVADGDAYEWLVKSTKNIGSKALPFDIYFIDADGNTVEVNTQLKIEISLPDGYGTPVVAYVDDSGTATVIQSSSANGTVIFTTQHNSYYVVTEKTESDKPGGDTPSGDKPSGDKPSGDKPSGDSPSGDTPGSDTPGNSGNTGDETDTPETGDNSNTALWLAVFLMSAAVIAVTEAERIVRKKRCRK